MTSDHYLIAEIGQAHDGSLGNAHSLIDLAADCGAHAVKFQMHIADVESGPEETWRVKFSKQDVSRYDYWKRMEFSKEQWQGLIQHCEEKGVDFMCSPFTQKSVQVLSDLGVAKYKIASGEVNNFLMLDYINEVAESIYLSSGMSDFDEIHKAINRFDNAKERLTVLQCNTSYPTPLENVGVNIVTEYKTEFDVKAIGLSDHSGKVAPSLLAYANGARVFEVHICFHKQQFGPDTPASLDPDEFQQLSTMLQEFSFMNASPVKKTIDEHKENRTRFGKSLVARKELSEGDMITFDALETRKPAGFGISPIEYEDVIGATVTKAVREGEFITWQHISKK